MMRFFIGLAALLVVALAYCHWNDRLPHWAQCSWCSSSEVARLPTNIIGRFAYPRKPASSRMSVIAVDHTGKDCVEQQLKLLGSARIDSIEKAKRLYLGNKFGGDEFVAYVTLYQDGDPQSGLKGLATLGKHIEWNFTAKSGAKFRLEDTRRVCICHVWQFAFTPPPAPPRPVYVPAAPHAARCAEYDYNVLPGDEVRYAAFTRGRMSASCWQLCDGDECSAPPSPCTPCDWLRPSSVIPDEYQPNYTGVYIAHHRKQRFFAPVGMMHEYFVTCVDRNGHPGDSDSWIAAPFEWEGRSSYTTPLGHVYLVPSSKWPEWGGYDTGHSQ